MTEVNENSDSGINSASIQLNEDDWLQLLQKLTPSSIESLQQTLKRLQTPEHITTDKPNPSVSLSNHSAAIHPSQSVIGQAHPIVMSLGMTKAPIAPVMAMPHVLNISKNAGNSLPGRIVLPSSALLITPQAPGQTYSLDSCVPVADLSRLVVTSGCLPNATTGLLTAASVPDTFSSLNTLANAAVAMAASASHWPPSVSVPSTTATVQQSNTFQFSPNLCTSTTSGAIVSPSSSLGELMHTTSNSTSDLTTPLLSSLGQTSLTVYPVHVSANGSTVLMAAPVTTTTTSTASLNTSRPCITTNTSVPVCSSSFGNYLNSVSETSTLSPLSITCNSNLSTNSVTSPGLVMSSIPRGKPKFKALWESTLSGNSDRINQPSTGGESSTNYDQTMSRSLEECTTATITTTTTTSGSSSRISRSNKRQSPMLGAKSIGQTPKRLAATAASLSQENKSNSSDGCRKKFLLICSPPKNTPIKSQMELDSGTFLPGNNPTSESNLLSAVTSSSSSSSVEVNAIESRKSTSGQPTTMSDDRETLSKVTERNSTVTTATANSNPLKHCTGSNISSSRDSSDIADSDPIGCEVFAGKTFESGRRSLKEETWPPSVSVPSTTATVQQSNTFQFSPNLCTSTTSGAIVSPSSSVGELMHTTSNSTSDLTTPLLSSLGQTSLTVYPVHVSANGSTVLMAAPVTTTTTSTASLNTSRPCITTNTSVPVCSSSFGNYLNSVSETSTLSPLSITCNSNLSTNSVTSPGLVMSSIPRGKPKFKALWESTLSGNSDRINQPSTGGESSTNYDQTISRSLEECTTATITTTTTTSGSSSRISRSNKRQSPMLGAKSIGQTPKRLAATAASLSQENKSNSSDGCRKKFLLICSPPKNTPIKSQMELDSGTFLPGNNPTSESNLLSAVTSSSSSSSSVEVNPIESRKSTSGQPTTMSDDRETLSKVTERNSTVTTATANSNPLKHCTGSNISSSRDSSDIADSDPIGCEVFVGKTFESGRRSLKEETVSDDEARRRAKRRERNRVAAAKCRQRRQDQIEELQHRVDALTRTGQELRSSLHSLDLERAKLETLIEEHKIAGCPAAEKILSLSKNCSDNSGSFENYADNLKTDELMLDSGYCDGENIVPVASLSSSSTIDSSTTLTTVTTSNSCKPISNLVNIHPCPPKLDIRCHNIRPNTSSSSSSSSSLPFVSNNSVHYYCYYYTTTTSSSCSNDNNSIITKSNNNTNCLILSTDEDYNQSVLVLKPEPEASGASRCATTTTTSTNTITTITGSTPSATATTTTTTTTTTLTPSVGTTTSATRLISRPSTLLPLSTLSTATTTASATSAQPLDMLKAQRQALSKVADCVNQVIPSLSNTSTSCFWSSNDLQNLSPILTPSTWKLLKNLTSASSNNSSVGSISNNNNNNNNGNNNNSSSSSSSSGSIIGSNTIQQSFLLTPTLSPLYSALPTQTFTSLTSMEALRSINNNSNSNNNISTTIDESNSLSNVNNTSQSIISGQHTNVASLLFSTKVALSNCDSSKSELSSHLHHPSALSTITNTTTTATTHPHHHHHHHGNSNDELSHPVQIQQSTQLNGQ
ncbi:unnamed protein product [Trichobilharzia szidati]|nr:unnamed protein product [Trichobilharzia szidati]